MKALKYVVAVVSAFLLLSMSALAADGEVIKSVDFTTSFSRLDILVGSTYTGVSSSFYGHSDGALVVSNFGSTVPAVTCFRWQLNNSPGVKYFDSFTSGVLYTFTFDFSFSNYPPLVDTTTVNPIRICLGNSKGAYSNSINPLPGSWSSGGTGGQVSFNFAVSDDLLSFSPLDLNALKFYIYPNKVSSSSSPSFAIHNFKISYTPTTQSVLDELERQGNLITGVINEQTGEITGKIDDVTDEILHGYDAPDFSGNQSTIDDYNNKEHELIDGTVDGKNEMESINNNALSAITSHVGAFVSVAQMMNDFINGHWFTNGLFTISASVGLLAVLLGAGVFAVGRFSGRQHSDARYEARRADRRGGRGR